MDSSLLTSPLYMCRSMKKNRKKKEAKETIMVRCSVEIAWKISSAIDADQSWLNSKPLKRGVYNVLDVPDKVFLHF